MKCVGWPLLHVMNEFGKTRRWARRASRRWSVCNMDQNLWTRPKMLRVCEEKLASSVSFWRDAQAVHHKHRRHQPPPHFLHKYYMNRGWTADICKIYCGLLLRGILRMPNIYHLNRWKLQRRDGSSVGVVNKGKGKAAEELAGWMCGCVRMWVGD